MTRNLSVVGLFAGIGGVELGLARAGHHAELLCEIDEPASTVLAKHFPSATLLRDVRSVKSLPKVDLVAAGFPCQDLSQAGRTVGINGARSGLVGEVFRLVNRRRPTWILLENVPFMLSLDQGAAMHHLVSEIEALNYRWAYRIVDSRSFGLPQRRRRVLFLASKSENPAAVLFADDAGEPIAAASTSIAKGFYWTEGTRGLGWAVDAIPTLKSGSTLGIPSPPAIWLPNGQFITPDIRDAERLQGFDANWTKCWSDENKRDGPRWKMVGNAVSVPVAEWVGNRLTSPGTVTSDSQPLHPSDKWPKAAYGARGKRYEVLQSEWPLPNYGADLQGFLQFPGKALSVKATSGFLQRARASTLHFEPGFLKALGLHLKTQRKASKANRSNTLREE